MNKRILKKKAKQFWQKNYIKTCFCGHENELKQTGRDVDEFLGEITFRYPHEECPIHGMEYISYHCSKAMEKAEKKILTKLLLEKRHPKFYEYISVEAVSQLTGISEKSLLKGHIWLYSLKYKGKRIYLKESVEKHLRTKHHGWVKLVDYKTEQDNWIRKVKLHPNYDVDVLFYDGTYRRKNILSFIESDEGLNRILIDSKRFLTPLYVSNTFICYGNEEIIGNELLYSGEMIVPFEGGIERREW